MNVQGKFWVIACKVSESVSKIKDRIKDKMGIDSERQILVFKGVQLQDTQKLEDCDVVDGATVHLVTRPGIARMPQQTSASSASMRNREPQASRVSKAQGAASSGDDAPLLPLPSRKHAQTSRGREAARDAPALNAGGQQAGGGGGSRAKREARIGAREDTALVGYEEDQAGRKLKPTPKPSSLKHIYLTVKGTVCSLPPRAHTCRMLPPAACSHLPRRGSDWPRGCARGTPKGASTARA